MDNILITGATSGIGLATAKVLSDTYRVLLTGSNRDKMAQALQALPENSRGYICDNRELSNIDALAATLKAEHQHLSGLFINAGMAQFAAFTEVSEAQFDEVMTVNFKSAYFTVQKLLPLLREQSSIVLTGSIVTQKAFANNSVYTASKAALESLAGVLNVELQTRRIRVNVVAPGITLTPIFTRNGMTQAEVDALEAGQRDTILGRIVQPEDVAHAVAFLLSPQSEAMRNARLVVDGGLTG